ncbi:MAG: hypothetical protein Q8P03_02240 [bacterium]|nr:hypothetical protein [bacterium]
MGKTLKIPAAFSLGSYDIYWYAKDNSNNFGTGLFDVVNAPAVTTQPATNIQGDQAILNANLTALGELNSVEAWFEYGTTLSYGNVTSVHYNKTATGPFAASLTGLANNTTYHFRAVAQKAGVAKGVDQQFTTSDLIAPVIQSFIINGTSCSGFNCPATVTATGSVNMTWSASDAGGSGIQKHEVWRAPDAGGSPGTWNRIQDNATSPFAESPAAGTYWYGVHTIDNAGNCINEQGNHCGGVTSDSLDERTVRGPIKVVFGDQIAPTVDSFSISPTTWTNGNITVTWTASDPGGSIQEVEVWRAPDAGGSPGSWSNIKDNATSGFQDSPPEGQWWYGIHVTDNIGNCIKEDTSALDKGHCGGVASDSLDTRTDRGPLKAMVDKTAPSIPSPLISPLDQSTVETENPSYSWTASTDSGGSGFATYHIQVDNVSNFNNPEDDRDVPSTNYTSVPNLTHAGYYWHVLARDNAGNESSYTPTWFFRIEIPPPNSPPNASFNCTPANCTVYDTETLTFNNNSTDPDGNLSTSEWDILNYGTAPDASCGGACNHTLQPIAPNSYTMQLTVKDSAGASDTDTRGFTVKRDIVAGFMCSLDNINFVACSSLSGQISQEEVLYLKDSSSLSEYTIVSQGASSVTTRTWKINGSTFGGNSSNPSTPVPTEGTITLELTAQDNQGRNDTQTHTLNPQVPFPEFQEISPF